MPASAAGRTPEYRGGLATWNPHGMVIIAQRNIVRIGIFVLGFLEGRGCIPDLMEPTAASVPPAKVRPFILVTSLLTELTHFQFGSFCGFWLLIR
jgi:hypothetical protein